MQYTFESERLGFREWIEADRKAFALLNSDKLVMRYFPNVLGEEASNRLFDQEIVRFNTDGFGLWAVVIKETKEFIGFIGFQYADYLGENQAHIEIVWRIRKEAWRHGFAYEGATACIDYGFKHLGITRLIGTTTELNHASIGVMRKLGFKYESSFHHPSFSMESPLSNHVMYSISRHHKVYLHKEVGESKDLTREHNSRISIRGVAIRNNQILLIEMTNGDYTIPGGGIEKDETAEVALRREMLEETGYTVREVKEYLGQVILRKTDKYNIKKQYQITTLFYLCDVYDEQGASSLSPSEISLGFKPIWLDINLAFETIKVLKQKKLEESISGSDLVSVDYWYDSLYEVLNEVKKLDSESL
jgi:RimJ/RimL family protein N-acetyltransferase/8-oxo-dGTP pyrophosphatase MutT (NUDIX family)